ncbi:MAG: exonuclease SbcCD subunit D [Methanospirillum sp.]
MSGRFAHLADLHIGAWRERYLADAAMAGFRYTIKRCIEEAVDFIVIAGDLFDATLPDLKVVREATDLLREVREAGIPVYVTYGSHDFSPNATSIIDVLHAAGLFVKVTDPTWVEVGGERLLRPRFFIDPRTGAKLAGLSGRKNMLEREYFERLDRDALECELGFKIFVFHTAVTGARPAQERHTPSISEYDLPPGFAYYAGGHIHATVQMAYGGGILAYPGPLLGHQYGDLERLGGGEQRGFFIVSFDDRVTGVEFVPVPLPRVIAHTVDGEGRAARDVAAELDALADEDCEGAVVLLRARGRLTEGSPGDVPFGEIRKTFEARGAALIKVSRYGLTAPEYEVTAPAAESREEIERRIFEERCNGFVPDSTCGDALTSLKGANATETAQHLLSAVATEPGEGEERRIFTERIRERALEALGHPEAD